MAYQGYLDSPAIIELVRRKARRMARSPGFTSSDAPDIEQRLFLKLLKAEKGYDPSKGTYAAFAHTVISRNAKSIAAGNRVRGLRSRRTVSIHISVSIGDQETAELSQQISVQEARKHRGVQACDDLELAQLVQDVQSAIETLSPKERDVAEALKSSSIAELARRMNVPRTTLYWTIKKIYQRFEDMGLREYLCD